MSDDARAAIVAVAAKPGARPRPARPRGARFIQVVVLANCSIPLLFLVTDWYRERLGPNPVDYVTRSTGTLALLFLALTLAMTPLRMVTGWGVLNRLRRTIGVSAFVYTSLHLVTYLWWDQGLDLAGAAADVAKRRFIAVGLAAWLILLALAVTSTDGMVKRLGGKRWKRLHRLTYLAAGLGVLHFYMLLKVPTAKLVRYGALIGLLLAIRVLVWAVKKWQGAARRGAA